MFPIEAGESLSHFNSVAPRESTLAPDFALHDIDGKSVSLSELMGEKPVVVQFGSYSCPVFRYRRFDMQALQSEFAGRVEFVVVYTQEAHPSNSKSPYADEVWNPFINQFADIYVPQHRNAQERLAQATAAHEVMDLNSRFLVDSMDNAVWQRYGAAPSPAYILDSEGRIILRQPWVNPEELAEVLNKLLENMRL